MQPHIELPGSAEAHQAVGVKVEAALLEAMEDRQITVADTTHEVPDLPRVS